MPKEKRKHLLCRKFVCIACGNKHLKCLTLSNSTALTALVKKHVDQEFRTNCLSKPEGICLTCKKNLYNLEKSNQLSAETLNNWTITRERFNLMPRFKGDDSEPCKCPICILVSDRRINLNIRDLQELFLPEEKFDLSPSKLCGKCFQEIGPGIRHPCSKVDLVSNLKNLLFQSDQKTGEQVISKSLRELKNNDEQTIKLATITGKPISLNFEKHSEKKMIKTETLFNLKRKHDLPQVVIDSIASSCRSDLGRSAVQSNSREKIHSMSTSLDLFYKTEKIEFEETVRVGNKKSKKLVTKDLTYVPDPTALILHLCDLRDLDVLKAIVRIGIDGGQGSLKIIMSLFDPDDLGAKDELYSGVNKVIVLGLVKGVSENHHNMDILFKKTDLNSLKCYLACDLKLLNIILGLSAHGGMHSCLYCEGKLNERGELRTFGSLRENYCSYKDTGAKENNMKDYKNVINPVLLNEPIDIQEYRSLMQTVKL